MWNPEDFFGNDEKINVNYIGSTYAKQVQRQLRNKIKVRKVTNRTRENAFKSITPIVNPTFCRSVNITNFAEVLHNITYTKNSVTVTKSKEIRDALRSRNVYPTKVNLKRKASKDILVKQQPQESCFKLEPPLEEIEIKHELPPELNQIEKEPQTEEAQVQQEPPEAEIHVEQQLEACHNEDPSINPNPEEGQSQNVGEQEASGQNIRDDDLDSLGSIEDLLDGSILGYMDDNPTFQRLVLDVLDDIDNPEFLQLAGDI